MGSCLRGQAPNNKEKNESKEKKLKQVRKNKIHCLLLAYLRVPSYRQRTAIRVVILNNVFIVSFEYIDKFKVTKVTCSPCVTLRSSPSFNY
jgi:hypothetical protein